MSSFWWCSLTSDMPCTAKPNRSPALRSESTVLRLFAEGEVLPTTTSTACRVRRAARGCSVRVSFMKSVVNGITRTRRYPVPRRARRAWSTWSAARDGCREHASIGCGSNVISTDGTLRLRPALTA